VRSVSKILAGATLAVSIATNPSLAQEVATGPAAPDSSSGEDVVVVTGESISRTNNVVSADSIAAIPAAQNILDAIKLVPGVQIRGADSFNNDPWSSAINIRGFEVNLRSSKIGQTLDGVPLFNASYYLAGAPAQKFVINENVESIQVIQGAADVGSPSSSALGGTIAYATRDPSEEASGLIRATFGDFNSQRIAARYDFGRFLSNTRGYLALTKLDSGIWPHGGSTPAGIEQFSLSGKSISEFGSLTVTAYGSYNESDDDPIIEATRLFIEQTGYKVDGSSSVFNTQDATKNEYWADEWASIRTNKFGYLNFDYQTATSLRLQATPYIQSNQGVGEFLPPFQEPRFVNTVSPGALRQVLLGGSRIRTTRANASGQAVLPYANATTERVYTALNGATVRSSECFNPDNTVKTSALGQSVCSSAQSYRNSQYEHTRLGVVANASIELGDHAVTAGVWIERLNRDFSRVWKPYLDIRLGPIALNSVYRADFWQGFSTDIVKFHVSDTWRVSDQLTVNGGLQSFKVDISGRSIEDKNIGPNGELLGASRLSVSSDSDLLPSLGAVYEVNDSLQLFAGYSRNFGAIGDWALEKTGTDLSRLKPETADSVDVGLRYRSDRLRGALSAYQIRYRDAIVFLTNDFAVGTPGINYSAGTGGTYFNLSGGVDSSGFEATAEYDISDQLTVYGAIAKPDATYTSSFRAASYGGNPVIVDAGDSVAGTPDLIASASLDYLNGPFRGVLSVRHVGEAAGDAPNSQALIMPAYTVVDLSASYTMELASGQTAELSAAVSNLTDERYIAGMLDEFTQRFIPSAPRTASVTVSFGF
jgi:iron complex outermembrane receptor protein